MQIIQLVSIVLCDAGNEPGAPFSGKVYAYAGNNGGTVIGMGGTMQANPSVSSMQRSVVYNGVSSTKGVKICVMNSSETPVLTFEFPRTISSTAFFFSTSDIVSGASYILSSGGSVSDYSDSWNGWFGGWCRFPLSETSDCFAAHPPSVLLMFPFRAVF